MSIKILDNLWTDSELAKKLELQKQAGLKLPRLLLTDIDGTFIDRETERGEKQATEKLIKYLNSINYGIVAITGRDITMMMRDYKKGILPLFDVVITSVGTERYILKDGKYVRDFSYDDYITQKLKFSRDKIFPYCKQFLETINSEISKTTSMLKGIDLKLQPRDRVDNQTTRKIKLPQPYKISFNFYGTEKVSEFLYKAFRSLLDKAGYPQVKIVVSIDNMYGKRIRNNIDILPIGKDEAANLLIKDLEHIFGRVFGVYAGDSMNDYHAIRLAGHAAIVVGGADENLLAKLRSLPLLHSVKTYQNGQPARYVYIEPDAGQRGPVSLLSGVQTLESWLIANSNLDLSELSTF